MAQDITVQIALVTIEFIIPASHSLKSKRRVVKSIKDRIRAKFNASVAEIAFLDEWQRSIIGVSMIGNDKRQLEQNAHGMFRLAVEIKDIELLNTDLEWL